MTSVQVPGTVTHLKSLIANFPHLGNAGIQRAEEQGTRQQATRPTTTEQAVLDESPSCALAAVVVCLKETSYACAPPKFTNLTISRVISKTNFIN